MIVAAVKADNAIEEARVTREREESDARAERRREVNAARQRRWRDNNAPSRVTSVSNGYERDGAPSFDKEKSPRPPKEIKSNPVGDTRPRKGTRIPENWTPAKPLPPEVVELCAQWPPGREKRELDGFRDYWISRQRDAARTDWDRTWWNRIRDQHDKIMRENRNGRQQTSSDGLGPNARAAIAVFGHPDDDEPRDRPHTRHESRVPN